MLGNPRLQRDNQTQVNAHASLCATPTCNGRELGEGETQIVNYAVTTISLESVPVVIGQRYYVVLDPPPSV